MLSLRDLSSPALAAAATANLVTHAAWVQGRTPGMRVIKTPGLVLVDSRLTCDTFNLVCRARLQEDATMRIREAIGYFAGAGLPFSWWLSPGDEPPDLGDLLLAAGLQRAETELAMAADLDALPPAGLPPVGLQIRRVRTPTQLQAFARTLAGGGTTPDPHVLRFYDLAAPALLDAGSPLCLYVGYLGETPVATSELALGGGVAGLYNISTLEAYRRRGFGTALTLQPLLDARSHGFRTAVLQAAPAGVSIYARVGFVPFGEIIEYKPQIPGV